MEDKTRTIYGLCFAPSYPGSNEQTMVDCRRPAKLSETALLGAKVAATTLGFRSPWASRPRGCTAASIIRRAALPLLCLAHTKTPPVKLVAVEPLDSLCGRGLLGETDEAKSLGTTGGAVDWQKHFCQMARFRKKSFKIFLRRIVA